MKWRARGVVTAILLAAVAGLAGFAQPRGRGVVIGTVVDGTSGKPIAESMVTIGGRGIPPTRVVVDPAGRFLFRDLPPGPITLVAARPGYFGGAAGQRAPTGLGQPIELGDGERIVDLTLRLWKYSAISGLVVAEPREPMVGVDVHALRRSLLGGQWRWSVAAVTSTDDRGHYRFTGLLPGEYAVVVRPDRDPETPLLLELLAANPASAADVVAAAMTRERGRPELDATVPLYPMTFFPAAPSIAVATVVTIHAGEERPRTDIHIKPARGVGIAGTLSGPATDAIEGLSVRLVPAGAIAGVGAALDVATTAAESDGRFEFSGVVPGQYEVRVLRAAVGPNPPGPPNPLGPPIPPGPPNPPGPLGQPSPAGPTLWAKVPVTVGIVPVTNVKVVLQRGAVVRGRLQFDGGAARPAPAQMTQINLRLDSIDQPSPQPGAVGVWRGVVDASGSFETMGVPPGKYLLRVGAATLRGWTPRSAMTAGRDMLDVAVEIGSADLNDVVIAFTDRPAASFTGSVERAQGGAAAGATVLVFPVDPAARADSSVNARRLRMTRAGQSGRYAVGGLPAGSYFVVAVNEDVPAEWQDPRNLESWSRAAARVELGEAQAHSLDLRTIK